MASGESSSRAPRNSHENSGTRESRDHQRKSVSPDIIAGKRAVLEALEAGVPLKSISIAQGSEGDVVDKVLELASHYEIDVEAVPRQRVEGKAPGLNHQGIVATAKPYAYSSMAEILKSCENDHAALIIVLDHITDVGNFGAIVRTAEIVGASGVVIPNRRSVCVTPASYKTSAGAVARVKIAMVSNISTVCDRLRENGFWVAGASEKAKASCWESNLSGKIGLVLGNEGSGISSLVTRSCDFLVRLPQRGELGSLNVSCAAAALSYEWMRQSVDSGELELG